MTNIRETSEQVQVIQELHMYHQHASIKYSFKF